MSEKKLRKEILNLVAKLYSFRKRNARKAPCSAAHYAGRVYDEKELESLVSSSLDFWLTAGKFAESFENGLCEFLGVKYGSLVNSGSSANLLAISALASPKLGKRSLKPNDEIITTACCFPTTVAAIVQNRLIPVFVDVNLATYNIEPEVVEKAISRKTKGIFIAHTLGNPADLSAITNIARRYGLWFVEDNCDALGSKYNGRFTGTFGDMATLSFYPAHHITTGEGGAVMTDDPLLHKIIVSMRDWGRDCFCEPGMDNCCKKRFSWKLGKLPYGYDHKYIYSHIGYNLKMTDMQAAIGVEQLKKLPIFIRRRKENFDALYKGLTQYSKLLLLPEWDVLKSSPSWFSFPITIRQKAGFSRQDLISFLEQRRIQTRLIFAGNILRQPAFEKIACRRAGSLKNTDFIMNNSFFIGVYPGLEEKHMKYILGRFDEFFKRLNL